MTLNFSKFQRYSLLILILITAILIGINVTENFRDRFPPVDSHQSTYTSEQTSTLVYTPEGALYYHLTASKVDYFDTDRLTWFTTPKVILFDNSHTPIWQLQANRAKLTKENLLYLYGAVEIHSLVTTSQLQRVTTDNALVNLNTQDVSSDDQVNIYGSNFTSTGLKMQGNLRDKTAKLMEQVRTSYEIQPQ